MDRCTFQHFCAVCSGNLIQRQVDHAVGGIVDFLVNFWFLHVYAGHTNERNFVGLSVTDDGYIATGSEDNSVVAYHASLPLPVARHSFSNSPGAPSDDFPSYFRLDGQISVISGLVATFSV